MEEEEGRAGAPARIFNQQMHHVDRYFILSDDMLRGFDFRSFFFASSLSASQTFVRREFFESDTRLVPDGSGASASFFFGEAR